MNRYERVGWTYLQAFGNDPIAMAFRVCSEEQRERCADKQRCNLIGGDQKWKFHQCIRLYVTIETDREILQKGKEKAE